MKPTFGMLTFLAEGQDIKGSLGYSREIHFPGNYSNCNKNFSGVTLGRGYDMGRRFKSEIMYDLLSSGIPAAQAKKITMSSMLKGCDAANFVSIYKTDIGEINEAQQLKLFNLTYGRYIKK